MPELLDSLKTALADRYAIQEELGAGGMATVYLAEDLKHHRKVAVKVLRPELAAVLGAERFLKEIEVTANLRHPHILPLFDSGEADGFLYYVMPLVEGESLRDRLNREKQLPVEDSLKIASEVADALGSAHRHNVIHRDIKPENILLEEGHAVVADFGVARAITAAGETRLTETGIAIGTPAYLSPEQATGERELDGRSDVYALGCVLYEMLAGQPPFTGPTVESIAHQHLTAEPPSVTVIRPAVPDDVVNTLEKALAKAPADRYQTAEELATALSAEQVSLAALPALTKRRVSRRVVAAIAAVTVIAVGALAVWQYGRAMADPGPPPPDRPYTVLATVEGSADSAMRETVEFLLRSGLDQAHVVQTVPNTEVQRLLTLMERPATAPLDPTMARELAERYGVSTVVLPRLDAVGNGFVVAVRVEDVAGGQFRAEATRRAVNEDALVETVDAVPRQLRRDLGESRAALVNTDPLPEVMTPSIEALRKYREGSSNHARGAYRLAVMDLREALTMDTAFAHAWARLHFAYNGLGEDDSSMAALRQALRFPDRLTEGRQRDLEAGLLLETDVTRWDEALELSSRNVLGPYEGNYAFMLSGVGFLDSALTIHKGSLERLIRRRRALDPSRTIERCWTNPWEYAAGTGRIEEWRRFQDSLQVDTPPACALLFRLFASLADGDWDQADSLLRTGPDVWVYQIFVDAYRRQLDAARGRIDAAHRAFARPDESSIIAQIPATNIGPAMISALILEVVYGIEGADSVRELTGRGWKPVLEYVSHGARAALVGDTSEAKRVLTRLRAMRDSATSRQFERAFGPLFAVIEAGPAARRGDWHTVIGVLEPWADQFRKPGYGFLGGDTYLIWWLLAEAYTQVGPLDSTILHLESVVGPPRYRLFDWTIWGLPYSAAHFKLGQLYTQIGDTAKAIEHYATFLDTFTDPDPEYEWMVEQARAEVVRLTRER